MQGREMAAVGRKLVELVQKLAGLASGWILHCASIVCINWNARLSWIYLVPIVGIGNDASKVRELYLAISDQGPYPYRKPFRQQEHWKESEILSPISLPCH